MPASNVTVKATFIYTGGGWGDGYWYASTSSATVKTDSAENGSFTVSDRYAKAGDTVEVTPKANEGYVVDQVIVTDKNGNPVTVKDNDGGTYSFVVPDKSIFPVNVKVTLKKGRDRFTICDTLHGCTCGSLLLRRSSLGCGEWRHHRNQRRHVQP